MTEEKKDNTGYHYEQLHNITNGAVPCATVRISFWKECKEIFNLIQRYSRLYVAKFIFLAFFVAVVSCVSADSYNTLIINAFIFLGGLLFDQLGKREATDKYDYQKVETFCSLMGYVIIVFWVISLTMVVLEGRWIHMVTVITLNRLKVLLYFALFAASFSALVEAVYHVPEAVLPSQQKKTKHSRHDTGLGQSEEKNKDEEI